MQCPKYALLSEMQYISVHLVARLSVFLVSFGSFMHLSICNLNITPAPLPRHTTGIWHPLFHQE